MSTPSRPPTSVLRDGRLLVVGVLALYAGAVAVARAGWDLDLWPSLGVNPGPTLFYDARNVAAAADCWALGYDPLVENPCDPSDRVMNYPRVWVLLHFAGVTQSRTVLFGAIVVALFLGSLWLVVGRLSLLRGVVVALAVASPAVMLAIERGNMDLVIFALFVLAVMAWGTRGRIRWILSPALIVAAAIAKLYAVFALPAYLLTRNRRAMWAVATGFSILALYVLITLNDIREVMRAPEGGLLYSYGARILIGNLYHRFSPGAWLHGNLLAQAIAVIPLLILSAAAWAWVRRRMESLPEAERMSPRLMAFHLGALTYLGTFAARKNGDYRLVFLLLTLPQLLEWATSDRTGLRTTLARAGVVAVVVGLWVGALSRFIGPWDELGSWAVAAVFVGLLAATVPRLSARTGRQPVPGLTRTRARAT